VPPVQKRPKLLELVNKQRQANVVEPSPGEVLAFVPDQPLEILEIPSAPSMPAPALASIPDVLAPAAGSVIPPRPSLIASYQDYYTQLRVSDRVINVFRKHWYTFVCLDHFSATSCREAISKDASHDQLVWEPTALRATVKAVPVSNARRDRTTSAELQGALSLLIHTIRHHYIPPGCNLWLSRWPTSTRRWRRLFLDVQIFTNFIPST
jgi:hypothetical protein